MEDAEGSVSSLYPLPRAMAEADALGAAVVNSRGFASLSSLYSDSDPASSAASGRASPLDGERARDKFANT